MSGARPLPHLRGQILAQDRRLGARRPVARSPSSLEVGHPGWATPPPIQIRGFPRNTIVPHAVPKFMQEVSVKRRLPAQQACECARTYQLVQRRREPILVSLPRTVPVPILRSGGACQGCPYPGARPRLARFGSERRSSSALAGCLLLRRMPHMRSVCQKTAKEEPMRRLSGHPIRRATTTMGVI